MRITNVFIATLLVCAVMLPATAQTEFTAIMNGAQEVPPNASPATGFGIFTLNAPMDSLFFSVHWSNLTGSFTASHFHHGAPGVAGPIVFPITNFVNDDSASGAWPIPDSNLVELLAGEIYINVHTSMFPAGEIRGQLVAEPDTAQFEMDEVGRSYCIHLNSGGTMPSLITLVGSGPQNVPVVSIRLGCIFNHVPCDTVNDEGGPIDTSCIPATEYTLGESWSFQDSTFTRTITGNGCVCVTLEAILPVEFGHLGAEVDGNTVALRWNTASETDLNYFEIARNVVGHGQAILLGRVNATNSPTGSSYRFTDENAVAGITYRYTLSVVDMAGARTVLGFVDATPGMPASDLVTSYALYPNYPNPFNPETQISFDLKEAGKVRLAVYDLMGRRVAEVVNGAMAAGRHSVSFKAASLPSGIYVYRIEVNGYTDQKKMVLLK